MSRFHSYINSSKLILENYNGEEPFSFHIKKYFGVHKNMGSKDRKYVSEVCYCWFRAFHLYKGILNEEVLLRSLFICNTKPHIILEALAPELNERIALSILDKLTFLNLDFDRLFPFANQLGNIHKTKFATALLEQPNLFLRIRPGQKNKALAKLTEANIAFTNLGEDALALNNSSHLEAILKLNKEAVVQDVSSQKVFDFLKEIPPVNKMHEVWDVCAASGGKSILLFDVLHGKIKLTLTDVRDNILKNANKRLQEAGINIYQLAVADVTKNASLPFTNKFDIIICDVPCTGSGTWSRTPEQLAFFKIEKTEEYAQLQKGIAQSALHYLKDEGLFFYITCSVFKKENEENVEAISKNKNLHLLHQEYITGYNQKADTLFVAVFKKSL